MSDGHVEHIIWISKTMTIRPDQEIHERGSTAREKRHQKTAQPQTGFMKPKHNYLKPLQQKRMQTKLPLNYGYVV